MNRIFTAIRMGSWPKFARNRIIHYNRFDMGNPQVVTLHYTYNAENLAGTR